MINVESTDFSNPFFEEPPEWLSEETTHGSLLGGWLTSDEAFTGSLIAESYKRAADVLVDQVVDRQNYDAHELVFPILFLYRHALEVRLKMLLKPEKLDHRLKPLARALEQRLREKNLKMPPEVMDRLRELATIDPDSFAFRYATDKKSGAHNLQIDESWVDLRYLKKFMTAFFKALEKIQDKEMG